MEFKTKFNLGDEIYFLREMTILSGVIVRIDAEISVENQEIMIIYGLSDGLPFGNEIIHKVSERIAFRSKEELLDNIKNK